jgi:DNA-binding transcriptional LysR family regulator
VRFADVITFGTIEAIKQAVAEGLGVAWLPVVTVQAELAAGTLVLLEVEGVVVERRFSVVRRRDTAPSAAASALVATLVE